MLFAYLLFLLFAYLWRCTDSMVQISNLIYPLMVAWAFVMTCPSSNVKMMVYVLVSLPIRQVDTMNDAVVGISVDTVPTYVFFPIDWKIKQSHQSIAATQLTQSVLLRCERLSLVQLESSILFFMFTKSNIRESNYDNDFFLYI